MAPGPLRTEPAEGTACPSADTSGIDVFEWAT